MYEICSLKVSDLFISVNLQTCQFQIGPKILLYSALVRGFKTFKMISNCHSFLQKYGSMTPAGRQSAKSVRLTITQLCVSKHTTPIYTVGLFTRQYYAILGKILQSDGCSFRARELMISVRVNTNLTDISESSYMSRCALLQS